MNIQWRFVQPVEFNHLYDQVNTNAKGVEGAVKLGIGIHDYLTDRELSEFMEEQTKQQEIDSANQGQMNRELSLIQHEITALQARNAEIQNEIENLNKQKQEMSAPDLSETIEETSAEVPQQQYFFKNGSGFHPWIQGQNKDVNHLYTQNPDGSYTDNGQSRLFFNMEGK